MSEEKNVKIVPAICTQCGGTVEVDRTKEESSCPFCGTTFIVEKAINNYNVKYASIEHADNVTIDVGGAVKEVLDFAGNQMKEERKVRQEQRKIDSEIHKRNSAAFFKLFGFMFAGMLVFALIAFVIMQFTGSDGEEALSEEAGRSVIECRVEDGALFTDIDIGDYLQWQYQSSDSYGVALSSEDSNIDSYQSCVVADEYFDNGVGYVVTAAYDTSSMSSDPAYYCVVRVVVEDYQITEASEPDIVESLSEYKYQ